MNKKLNNLFLLILGVFFALNTVAFFAKDFKLVKLALSVSLEMTSFFYFILALFFAFFMYLNIDRLDRDLFKKILLSFLPMILISVYGLGETKEHHHFLTSLTSLYFIIAFWGFLFILKKYQKFSDFLKEFKPSQKIRLNHFLNFEKSAYFWTVFLVFVLFLVFGSFHLTKYAAVDEALWTEGRIPKFWNNIQDGELEKTNVSDKPGITVAIISGIGLNWVNPKEYKYETYSFVEKKNLAFRLPILLFCSLMIFIFFGTLKRLFGKEVALVSVILIWLSPLLLGISTIINPDSLLWLFTSLSIFSYFLYTKENKNKDLYLAGIFLGLSLLTKYIANILYVFFLGIIFLNLIFKKEKEISAGDYLKKYLLDYFTLVFFSLFTFFVLLPATWIEPKILFESTLLSQAFQKFLFLFLAIVIFILFDTIVLKNKILSPIFKFLSKIKNLIFKFFIFTFLIINAFVVINVYLKMKWFDMESILASPKTSFVFSSIFQLFLTNFYSLIFGITPIVLLGIIYFLIKSLKNRNENENSVYIFYLLIFIMLYYLGSSLNNVSATVRYQIILYPLASIVGAFGLWEFFKNIKILEKYKATLIIILLMISASSLYFIRPFYFSYANFLLPKEYVLNLKDMGDGSYEAARYLNSLPDAKNLKVWTDKSGVCQFFVGKFCQSGFSFDKKSIVFDYFVVSAGRQSRTSKMTLNRVLGGNTTMTRLDKLYLEEETVFRINIGGRENNFIKIISGDKVDQNY